jgi:hypothetical protein
VTAWTAADEAADRRMHLLTDASGDKFVAGDDLFVAQAGVDDLTLVGVLEGKAVARAQKWTLGAPRTRWGGLLLGSVTDDGRFEPHHPRHRLFFRPNVRTPPTLICQVKLARPGGLAQLDDLPRLVERFGEWLAFRSLRPAGPWRVSRVDVAADAVMPSVGLGERVLLAEAHRRLPRGMYAEAVGPPPYATAYQRSRGCAVMSRTYSRHRETGRPAGEVIRFEVQHKYKPQVAFSALDAPAVKRLWTGRFIDTLPAGGGVHVGQQSAIARDLQRRVEAGELTFGKYEQALGYLLAEQVGLASTIYPARRLQDRRNLSRTLGVEVCNPEEVPVEIALADLLGQVAASPAW